MAALLTTLGISIHAPREGGDRALYFDLTGRELISIHAPREGGDLVPFAFRKFFVISIHAPREGGDCAGAPSLCHYEDFNPRPPRGGRHLS